MRSRSLSQFKITISVFLFVFSTIYFSSKCISLDQILSKGHISHFSGYEYNYKNNRDVINHRDGVFGTTHDKAKYPFTVVTAASGNHFCAIQSWIYYMKGVTNSMPLSKRPRIIIYDIGLLDHQSERLRSLHKKGYFTEFRKFDFDIYPEFWRIVNGTRGEYGWKPGIISEVARDYPGQILWLDSGSYVTPEFLKHFKTTLNHYDGFFSPTSSGYMSNWTHPGVFEYFNDNGGKYSKFVNCNGAAIAFDSNKVGAMMNSWVQCALVKDCIAPKGSSRVNHRQDQAILTYLVAREKRFCVKRPEFFGLRTHMDKSCKKNIYSYEKLNNIIWS